jgi:hypothetical protein
MFKNPGRSVLSPLLVLLALIAAAPLQAQKAPAAVDATLFTTYAAGSQSVNWVVCGSTQQTEGCYASGGLGSFGRVGALMEGAASTKSNVVTRAIYLVDVASGTSGTGVTLYIYKKTDTVTSSTDTVSVTLSKTVTLPLTGGSTAQAFMAANSTIVFIGTDQSSFAVEVQKFNFKVTQVGAFSTPVSGITADPYGYVTVNQGDGFAVFGPTGGIMEDGGGTQFMLNTITGALGPNFPAADDQPLPQVGYRPKRVASEAEPN